MELDKDRNRAQEKFKHIYALALSLIRLPKASTLPCLRTGQPAMSCRSYSRRTVSIHLYKCEGSGRRSVATDERP